jgi:hypothetical protein
MQFDYKEFLIDASPLDEGGRYTVAQRSTGGRRRASKPLR